MIKALLFDFDGLLMDTESTEVHIWQEIYAEHGADFPIDIWIRDVVGSTMANFDVAAHLAAVTGRTLDLPALHERVRTSRLARQSRLSAMPGVTRMLASARVLGLRMAIVSSSPHWWVDGYLRQLKITDFFEFVICREDAPRLKPAPDLYLKAMHSLQLAAAECLAFEDSPNGVLAAKRAGLRVVGVPNPVTVQAGPLKADLVLSSLEELPLGAILERFEH
jgi:HAD superfamily hydrolase (TIGR01509 family)